MTFGEKLQMLRKKRGLSQEKLALQLSVSRQAVSKWEQDQSLPDTERVIQIGKLFDVSLDYLLNEKAEYDGTACGTSEHAPVLQERRSDKTKAIIGTVLACIGLAGNVVLLVLSTMIQVHVTKKLTLPDGSVRYYGGGDVLGYSFKGFIEEYRLQALVVVFTVFVVAGIAVLINNKRVTEI